MSAIIAELAPDTFKAAISTGTVLVDFWGTHCAHCKTILPVLEELAADPAISTKLTIVKVKADEHRTIAAEYGIRAVPTFLIFKDGQPVEKIVGTNGITTKTSFAARLQPHLQSGTGCQPVFSKS